MVFDTDAVRREFPILERRIQLLDGRTKPIVYMDHGASTHAPRPVLDAVQRVLTQQYANIHRGNHTLSLEASDLFDEASDTFLDFIGANPETHCAILGQNTTMALDIAAHVMQNVPGDTLTTAMEHHSNDLPHRRRGTVHHAEVDEQGRLNLDDVQAKLEKHPIKLLAVTGASNVTGAMPPIHKLARLAHDHGARILVDAAQLYAHAAIDCTETDHPEHLDFVAAAGHKAYAPLGSAFLSGPRDLLDAAPPYMPGGGTVDWVTDDSALFTHGPDRHMGGTPNIVGAIAFAEATRWMQRIGMDAIREHELELLRYGMKRITETSGLQLFGPRNPAEKVGVMSFAIPNVRHEMVASILNHEHGVAVRNGCFCAHPLLHRLLGLGDTTKWRDALAKGQKVDLPGATRATIGIYNNEADVDALVAGLEAITKGHWKGTYEMVDTKMCQPREATLVDA